jgi:subfamily B ATP-binding cassette protein HlyB/CyaB
LIVVILAIYLHIENELTLGQVIASTSIVGFIIFPVINLMKFLDDFKQVGVSFKRINEVVSSATETFGENKVSADIDLKKISVDKLSFKYGNELSSYAIKNITLDIDVGKNYAFVGSSGAGKTTLAQMLVGYDWPVSGNIKVDGLNINMINLEELRRLVAYVGAEPITFSGTIVENISLDSTDSSIEKVIEAAKIADAHEFISSLPFGYMTLLGESGQGLSLGQKQKICIARALYARPKVLILDEATSILDSSSERSIFQNLKDTMIGRSLIIVTHRLHLLNQVEQIVVIHNGEVVEKGAHDDLIMLQGRYYEMWKDINY